MADPNGGYYNLYGSTPQPQSPAATMFGLKPGAGGLEGVAQSVMPMIAEMFRNQFGVSAFTFGSDMNVTSARNAQQYMLQMQNARNFGAKEDEGQIRELMSGFARMLGHNMNDPETTKFVGRLSGDLSQMLPQLAAIFPDQVDKWMPRGSLTVASGSFVNAGRFVTDPYTGQAVSQDAAYASRVLGPLLKKDASETGGLGAGRLGGIYEQLVGRGIVDSGEELRKLVAEGKMTPDEGREVQADKVRAQLKSYSKAIGAINDIFAEAGRPNSSMSELFDGLRRLSGGLGNMSPEMLAEGVRTAHAASQRSGMGLQATEAIAGQYAAGLRAGGGATSLSLRMATYTNLLGRTQADAGLVFDGPEGQTIEDVVNDSVRLKTAGATSDYGKAWGAVAALGYKAKLADPESPMAKVLDAMRRDERLVTVPDGKGGTTTLDLHQLDPEVVNKIAFDSGMGSGALQMQMLAPGQIRGAQSRENVHFDRAIASRQETAFREQFLQLAGGRVMAGVDRDKLYETTMRLSALGDLYKDDASLSQAIAKDMGLSEEQSNYLSSFMIGQSGGRTRVNEFNPELRKKNEAAYQRAVMRGWVSEALVGEKRGTFGRNVLMSIIQGGSMGEMAMNALGGVPDNKFLEALDNADKMEVPFLRGVFGYRDKDKPKTPVEMGTDAVSEIIDKAGRDAMNGGRIGRGGRTGPGGMPEDGPTKTEVNMVAAKVIFESDGRMTITGGGAMRTT